MARRTKGLATPKAARRRERKRKAGIQVRRKKEFTYRGMTIDKLKELTNFAFQKDIFGAPTFVVNNKIFWGQDRLEYALDEYNS